MKNRKTAIASVLIMILGVCFFGISRYIHVSREQDTIDGSIISIEEIHKVNVSEKSTETFSDDGSEAGNNMKEGQSGDWYELPGYINGVNADVDQNVCGIALPFQIKDTPIVINGIGQYTGPFVEDGNDKPVANSLAIIVKNESDVIIEFAEIKFKINDAEEAVFQMSTIPAGKSAIVLEKAGKEYHAEDSMIFFDKLYAQMDSMSLMEKQLDITAEDNMLTVKNLTQEDMDIIYIRYKNKINEEYYLGGITYSCKVKNVKKEDSAEVKTGHFSSNGSQVLMVEAIQE